MLLTSFSTKDCNLDAVAVVAVVVELSQPSDDHRQKS